MKIIYFFAAFLLPLATQAENITIDYPPFTQAATPVDFINQLYVYALGISGTLAVIMIVYGGVKYIVSVGSAAAQSEAKDILKSSVWGIVLLMGAYLVLRTINPSLVELKDLDLKTPPLSRTVVGEANQQYYDENAVIARQLLSMPGMAISGIASCQPGSDPRSILGDVANKKFPLVCSSGCDISKGCQIGGSTGNYTLKKKMLEALVSLQSYFNQTNPPLTLTITSFTGGNHSRYSVHYRGRAVDLVPASNNPQDWTAVIEELKKMGASEAQCDLGGRYLNCSQMFEGGQRKSGAHIHAEF